MYRAFNMGIGLVLVCAAAAGDAVLATLAAAGEPHVFRIGRVVPGDRAVRYV